MPTRMIVEGGKPLKAFAARGGECVLPPPSIMLCCVLYARHVLGSYHSAVLSDTGHLYTCGANGCGQLGLEHEKMTFFLTPVKALFVARCLHSVYYCSTVLL